MKKIYFSNSLLTAFFAIVLLVSNTAHAQETEIYQLKDDTAKVNRMILYVRQINNSQPEAANRMILAAEQLSEKIHYDLGLAAVNGYKAVQFCNKMELDSARWYNDKALRYVTETKSVAAKNQLAIIYNSYGVICQQKQLYDSATQIYLKVVELADETGNHARKTGAFYNLSIIYSFLRDSSKTARYARLAVTESKITGDTALMLRTTLALLNSFANDHIYDSVLPYARPALAMARQKNDRYSEGKMLVFIGDYFKEKMLYDSAHQYLQQSLKITRALKFPYDEAIVLFAIGNTYLAQKKYAETIVYQKQALKIEDEYQLLQFKTETLKSLADAEENSGHLDQAYLYLKDYVMLNDSLTKKTNEEAVQILETKYQLQNKENTIALQKAAISQKNTVNYILIGTAVALFIISLLTYRNYRHRQKLQQSKIEELETEKQLTATSAVLKGEEQERTRLARDLHDGLGGMLSGIKYSLSNMKGNLVMTTDNAQAFERSIDMLDSSIREMRRVAHNMMPEVLVKYGLDTALKEFCSEIDNSGVIHVNYHSIGITDEMIDQTAAVTIYRIVQELVNNAIKHAAAENVLVQLHLTDQEKLLAVTVEDDGQGFDTAALKESAGIGWKNIQSRVEFLQGKIDIASGKDKGTSILIEINT